MEEVERRGVYSLEELATAELLEQNQLLDVVPERVGDEAAQKEWRP